MAAASKFGPSLLIAARLLHHDPGLDCELSATSCTSLRESPPTLTVFSCDCCWDSKLFTNAFIPLPTVGMTPHIYRPQRSYPCPNPARPRFLFSSRPSSTHFYSCLSVHAHEDNTDHGKQGTKVHAPQLNSNHCKQGAKVIRQGETYSVPWHLLPSPSYDYVCGTRLQNSPSRN